jgi:hypothetical protein
MEPLDASVAKAAKQDDLEAIGTSGAPQLFDEAVERRALVRLHPDLELGRAGRWKCPKLASQAKVGPVPPGQLGQPLEQQAGSRTANQRDCSLQPVLGRHV